MRTPYLLVIARRTHTDTRTHRHKTLWEERVLSYQNFTCYMRFPYDDNTQKMLLNRVETCLRDQQTHIH